MQVPSAELREEQLVASESARGDLARRTRAPRATATTATNKVKRVAAVFMKRSGAKPELVAIALVYLVQGLLRLSSLAVFIAALTLLGDALVLIYTFLDGQMTSRFLAKSAVVAGLAGLVLGYFRQDRAGLRAASAQGLAGLAALVLALSFASVGGPGQGQIERRDEARIADLRQLTQDVRRCLQEQIGALPEDLAPMDCASNPSRLTGYAAAITYQRRSASSFALCTEVEFPPAIPTYDIMLEGTTACLPTDLQ